jgi:peptidoglycan/xylan/chitin deacetylase (PgdA/CDA1 family)
MALRHGLPDPLPRHMLCRVEGVSDAFAITFDDGPSPRNTPRLLEVLARRGARATFFQLGRNLRRHPDLTRAVLAAGHEVGLHDDLHLPPVLLPAPLFAREFRATKRALARIADAGPGSGAASGESQAPPRFYRPPFGWLRSAQARLVRAWGFEPVLGDVFPGDPERPGVEAIVERALAGLRGGSILILHDGSGYFDLDRGQTIEAAGILLDEMARRGLRAVAVGELVALGARARALAGT